MAEDILPFIFLGIAAQMVDGALGMAYGVISMSALLGMGVPPALASASVKMAEVFTTLVSGTSHLRMGNVDKAIVKRLIPFGVLGGILGAYVLSSVPGDAIRPYVAVYLGLMGVRILYKLIRKSEGSQPKAGRLAPLAAIGGFLDAVGGGGWGPIVTATLVARGHTPSRTVGSVNFAEFFVTTAQAASFVVLLGTVKWQMTIGLLVGGTLAAPFAALACRRIPARAMIGLVGTVVVVLSARTLLLMFQ